MSMKQFYNTSDHEINVLGVGVIPAGERVSISTEHQPVVILENYPGLVDSTDLSDEVAEAEPESVAQDLGDSNE